MRNCARTFFPPPSKNALPPRVGERVGHMPSVAWSVVEGESFSVPFNVSAHSQRLWITADKDGLEHELHVKGTNWVRRRPPPD